MNQFQIDFPQFLKGYSEKDIREFFLSSFIEPLVQQLLGDPKIPAEEIRQKLKQTQHIEQTLINLSKK